MEKWKHVRAGRNLGHNFGDGRTYIEFSSHPSEKLLRPTSFFLVISSYRQEPVIYGSSVLVLCQYI